MKICLLLPLVASALLAQGVDEPLTLARVLRDVSEQHPRVRAALALASAEGEKVSQASAWEDPTVGVEMMRQGSMRLNRYNELEWSVSQKLPLTAQRKRRVALAKAEADAAVSNAYAELTPLLIQATDAFYHLAHARELLDLAKGNDEILAKAVSAVQARLAAGVSDVASVLLAETERARLQEQVIAYERDIGEATTLLNTVRNLPPELPIGALDVTQAHLLATTAPFEVLRDRALANRPELRAAEAKITVADRTTDVARAWFPDPEVMVRARTVKGNSDPISEYDTAIAISVPWFNRGKYRAAIRESQLRREAAELDVAALRSQTVTELRDAWTRYESATRSVALYQDRLAPLAERALDAASTGLSSGKSGILELLAAQKNLIEVRNALIVARAERARAIAVLSAMSDQLPFTLQ